MTDIKDFLKDIKKIKEIELLDIDSSKFITYEDKKEQFKASLKAVAGNLEVVNSKDFILEDYVAKLAKNNKVVNTLSQEDYNLVSAKDYQDIDIIIVLGEFGVAENGAIWIKQPDNMDFRSSYFLPKSMVVILEAKNIYHNMFEAYENISFNQNGFGVFISGPSKTADIEQILVIGAHGAKEFTVILKE